MKIRSQIGMVLNLDKCIGCHTCSVTCKNVWTSREGTEYAWFNNVETKPGLGYPTDWENQEKWKGGWIRKINGKLQPRMGNRAMLLGKIFANPHLPGIDDYYEPFDYDYQKPAYRAGRQQSAAGGSPSLADYRPANEQNRSRPELGKSCLAESLKNARRTRTSSICKRRCTASSKTPS
ncbi:Respiratory nitrate reductase 1 beta chain [Cedecea neteri]|uniref:Respiratory nitrate reductase 1 beta chain n=1 Tax=Cedecea neteri TaxID=158822 RepID=A0A2X3IJW0_9ENTR|nr:Respiratory nitrate reductase 1 beta chain [Cedecea neteri]